MSDAQKWSLLLVGKNLGLVAQSGNDWKGRPEHYEQVEVVRVDLYDKQAERIAELEGVLKKIRFEAGDVGIFYETELGLMKQLIDSVMDKSND